MNDHRYVPYSPEIGDTYRASMGAVVRSFQAHGVRVVLGSPGPVGKLPSWVKSAAGTVLDLNLNLAELRNIDVQLAAAEKTAGFADVFQPMLAQEFRARLFYGTNFAVPGRDGVHPGLAGQTMMARPSSGRSAWTARSASSRSRSTRAGPRRPPATP